MTREPRVIPPGEGYLVAEAAEQIGLPPGVLNVLTADREVSELLDGHLQFVRRGRQQLVERGVEIGPELTLSAAQLEGERHETLLSTVVEVALDTTTLLVLCRDDPRP